MVQKDLQFSTNTYIAVQDHRYRSSMRTRFAVNIQTFVPLLYGVIIINDNCLPSGAPLNASGYPKVEKSIYDIPRDKKIKQCYHIVVYKYTPDAGPDINRLTGTTSALPEKSSCHVGFLILLTMIYPRCPFSW